jgi:hypothetical protein
MSICRDRYVVGDGWEIIIIKNRCQGVHPFWFIDVVGGSWFAVGDVAFGFIRGYFLITAKSGTPLLGARAARPH